MRFVDHSLFRFCRIAMAMDKTGWDDCTTYKTQDGDDENINKKHGNSYRCPKERDRESKKS